ncbi:MAG: hypothetical protein GVY28_08060 [Alphaproteobacteria bacterium]|jgi:precorrin-8X/cobalt-precorrin-8 methylmutase|nr:hypothetical protein [Alphaproteobacteria bacterium]
MLFDAYLFVDWSASNRPRLGIDSIWICQAVRDPAGGSSIFEPVNPPTRRQAIELIHRWLVAHVRGGRRVLVGYDFPLGYPAGFAASLTGRADAGWEDVWQQIDDLIRDDVDGRANRNNRWSVAAAMNGMIRPTDKAGPFWGCIPANVGGAMLTARRHYEPPYPAGRIPLARFRHTERRAQGVQETWKLAYAGSVGSQTLMGIPRVRRLRQCGELASVSRVWPFETGFGEPPSPGEGAAFVLHAEIWPGLVDGMLEPLAGHYHIRDQQQVYALCRWAAAHDAMGTLGSLLDPTGVPHGEQRRHVLNEEGWILGS